MSIKVHPVKILVSHKQEINVSVWHAILIKLSELHGLTIMKQLEDVSYLFPSWMERWNWLNHSVHRYKLSKPPICNYVGNSLHGNYHLPPLRIHFMGILMSWLCLQVKHYPTCAIKMHFMDIEIPQQLPCKVAVSTWYLKPQWLSLMKLDKG